MSTPRRPYAWGLALGLLVLALVAVGFALLRGPNITPASETAAGSFRDGPDISGATVWALGDSADGGSASRRVGAMIAADQPDRFIYLGDVYENGTPEEFTQNYQTAFGGLRQATLPTPGNHDWPQHASGYDPYWSAVSGKSRPPDFYSVDVGGWELLSLNSESPHNSGSPQWTWLQEQTSGAGNCRIAFWHRPRYSAGKHGDQEDIAPLWDLLAGKASVVLNGHEHNMQRLEPIDGVTTLIAGAGGHSHYRIDEDDQRVAFANTEADGALRLELRPGRLEWRFESVDGEILDHGQLGCQPG